MAGKASKHAGSRFWVERAVSLKCPVFYHDFMGKWGKNGVRNRVWGTAVFGRFFIMDVVQDQGVGLSGTGKGRSNLWEYI